MSEVLHRVEAGEEITVTVAGRPVAELRPIARNRWVSGAPLDAVFTGPAPRGLLDDMDAIPGALVDPFAR